MPRSSRSTPPSVDALTADLVGTRRRLDDLRAEQERLKTVLQQQEDDLAARLCPFSKQQRVPFAPNVLLEVSRVKLNLDDPQRPTWTLDGYRRSYGPGKSQGAAGLRDWLHQADYEALPDDVRAQTHESLSARHAPRVSTDGPLRLTDPMRSLLNHARTFFQNRPGRSYCPSGVSWGSPGATKKVWLGLVQQGVVQLTEEAQSRGVSQDSPVHHWLVEPGVRYPEALALIDAPRAKPGKARSPSM